MQITITADVPEEQIKEWYKDCTKGALTDQQTPWQFAADIAKLGKDATEGRMFEVCTRGASIYLSTYCEKFGGFSLDVVAFRPVPEVPQEFLDRLTNQTKQATSHSLPKEESSHA